ncbi:MAG: ATP-dependent DNA helicase RecG [Candidatus Woykebacteria bacterium]
MGSSIHIRSHKFNYLSAIFEHNFRLKVITLNTPIGKFPFIGPTYATRLKKLNIDNLKDLFYHFPAKYEDRQVSTRISEVRAGEKVSLEGVVWEIRNVRTKYGKNLTFALINDGSGSINCVWFNQPYLTKSIKQGQKLGFSGKSEYFNANLSLVSPDFENLDNKTSPIHTKGLVPIYPETAGVTSKWLRSRLSNLLSTSTGLKIYEVLPMEIVKKYKFANWLLSMKNIHFPANLNELERAKERFKFEELYLIQVRALKRKAEWSKQAKVQPFTIDQEKLLKFIASLPFDLTNAQKRSIKEIIGDLGKKTPMNRLLQGDVGSGKTVIAALSSYVVILQGYNTVFMAPTEILANQHFKTLETILNPFGISVGLQTSARKTKEDAHLTVGTQALLFKNWQPKTLGLIIIDEQQRFGVAQRAILREKGVFSHFLTMSATPIPRTMALTLWGDLDFSVLDEMPSGRQRIKTYVVPKEKRDKAYNFIRKEILEGRQAFIICPFINPSETLSSVRSAKQEWQKLSSEVFPDLKVELLHGRLSSSQKQSILEKFRRREADILVSTPVVEVGIDIPNAAVMMIEGSDRFGLAQLHQIRGRVGRSSNQSFCFLFTENDSPSILSRLRHLEKNSSGLSLAELDLKLRGPGEIFGLAQSGFPPLKLASFMDKELIKKTHEAAKKVIDADPELENSPSLQEIMRVEKTTPD